MRRRGLTTAEMLELVGVTQGDLPRVKEPLVLVEPKPGCFGFARESKPDELVPMVMSVTLAIEEFPVELGKRLSVPGGTHTLVQLCGFAPPAGMEFCVVSNHRKFFMHALSAGTRAFVVQQANSEYISAHTERVFSVSVLGHAIFDEVISA